jgi:amidophosphoribosyltransferase
MGYARRSGLPPERGFIRNHYVGRTFIMPAEGSRGESVRIKLNAVRSAVKGKRLVVVDDTIVRGTTSRERLALLREAGAREIHVRISAPPCRFPCWYGIDFPSPGELIAASHAVEEIRSFLGVESLAYQTVEGLLSAVAAPSRYCAACFTGEYPEPPEEPVFKGALESIAPAE